MNVREFDLFEKVDGSLIWRATVVGCEDAIRQLREVAAKTKNECCLMHTPTKTESGMLPREPEPGGRGNFACPLTNSQKPRRYTFLYAERTRCHVPSSRNVRSS